MKIIVERTNFVAVSSLTGLRGEILRHKYVFIAAFGHKSEIVDSRLLNKFQLELYLSSLQQLSSSQCAFMSHGRIHNLLGPYFFIIHPVSRAKTDIS